MIFEFIPKYVTSGSRFELWSMSLYHMAMCTNRTRKGKSFISYESTIQPIRPPSDKSTSNHATQCTCYATQCNSFSSFPVLQSIHPMSLTVRFLSSCHVKEVFLSQLLAWAMHPGYKTKKAVFSVC